MKYIQLLFVALVLCISRQSHAQEIRFAYFEIEDFKPGIQRFELEIADFAVTIDGDGDIISIRPIGRIQGFINSDIEFTPDGKSSSINGVRVEYYDIYDGNKAGKIKSINRIQVDYYSNFDIHDLPGKLKSIGKITFKYNNAFDIHDQKGTLKSVGDINIKYNTAFDIHDQKGTLKSIGSVKIGWYSDQRPENGKVRLKFIRGNNERISVQKPNTRRR